MGHLFHRLLYSQISSKKMISFLYWWVLFFCIIMGGMMGPFGVFLKTVSGMSYLLKLLVLPQCCKDFNRQRKFVITFLNWILNFMQNFSGIYALTLKTQVYTPPKYIFLQKQLSPQSTHLVGRIKDESFRVTEA